MGFPGDERLRREREHGRRISRKAEVFWGWSGPAGRRRVDRRVKTLSDFLGSTEPPCLEIGCGKGVFTRRLAGLFPEGAYVSMDISFDLLSCVPAAGLPARPVQGDAHRLPFRNGRFGAVFGVSVLHHVRYGIALRELFRVLAPGGRLLFMEPNIVNPAVFVQKMIPPLKAFLADVPHETAFLRGWLVRDLAAAGFRRIEVRPFDFLHPAVPEPLVPGIQRLGGLFEELPGVRELAGSLLIRAERLGRG